MMERLSGFDATFLYTETPAAPFEIASCVVVDAARSLQPYSFEAVREAVAARLHLAPKLRQRLVHVPFELDVPVWVDDPDFDLDRHVHRAALPPPGGTDELAAWLGDALTRPLDRDRPLWELYVVEGLAGGRIAGFVKTHHAAVDGIAGFELLTTFLDERPDAAPPAPSDDDAAAGPGRVPSPVERVLRAVPTMARQPLATTRTLYELALGNVRRLAPRRGRSATPSTGKPASSRVSPFDAPRTRYNSAVQAHRRAALVDLPFDDVERIAKKADCTINDVLVAVVGGGVRRHLLRHGELPGEPLVAFVPVSTRGGGGGSSGNRTSLMYASMATDVDDARGRLDAVAASTRRAKSDHSRGGAGMPTDLIAVTGAPGAAVVGKLLDAGRVGERLRLGGNVVVSNIPGPDRELFFAGAPVERLYPFGPLVAGNALNVTVLSYRREHLSMGQVAGRDAVPDLAELADDVHASFTELDEAVA